MKKTRDIILVCGKTGQGKTQWVKSFIKGQKRVILLDIMGEYDGLMGFDNFDTLIDNVFASPVFRVKWEEADGFEALSLTAMKRANTTLIIEEAQKIIPPKTPLPPEFFEVIMRGRHSQVNVVLVCQRISSVSIDARSQFTKIICFRQTEKRDLQWIDDATGLDNIQDLILDLKPLEYLDITASGECEKRKITRFLK